MYFHQYYYKINPKEIFQNFFWNSKIWSKPEDDISLWDIHRKDVFVPLSSWEGRSLHSFLRKEHMDISKNNFHFLLQKNTKVTFLLCVIGTFTNMRGNFLPGKVKTLRISFTLHTFLKWKLINSYKQTEDTPHFFCDWRDWTLFFSSSSFT